jgi:hypothetical protein
MLGGLLMVAGLFGIALLDYAKTHEYLGWSGNVDVVKLFLALWAIAFFLLFGMLIVKSARCGATCPHCRKRLQAISAQITVATGYCGYCGEQIFEQTFKKA